MTQTKLTLITAQAAERQVKLRMPFKFGIVTLREAPQLFLSVTIRLADGRIGQGIAAELLAPKWFDKNPDLSNEENFAQLRLAVKNAVALYQNQNEPRTAFGLHAEFEQEQIRLCEQQDLNPLIASFGTALADRAIIDAIGRLQGRSVFALARTNELGITAQTAPDLKGFDLDGFLRSLKPAKTIAARHTVGLVDALTQDEILPQDAVGDGLPESLEAAAAHYGLTHFKLKVSGNISADLERLTQIVAVLDTRSTPYAATLDGNEQYDAAEPVIELWSEMAARPQLARLCQSILFIEQPIKRAQALSQNVEKLATLKSVEIDESDATMDAYAKAKSLGYEGVSSKSCKGFYRSLLNRARMEMWNQESSSSRFFMSAEDLTTQAGIAVQQDLALASLIGCTHVERNGHHYVNGMTGVAEDEQRAFAAQHGDLYHQAQNTTRLTIANGVLNIGSLDTPGLASAVIPDLATMSPVDLAT